MDHLPDQYPEYRGHPDAPLTPLGHQQAEEAADFLQRLLGNTPHEHLIVECSPYWRCMQTIEKLATALNLTSV